MRTDVLKDMTYKQCIIEQCNKLAENKKTVFIGYNTACGSRMYGTLEHIPQRQCIETPVAENLMMGLAMGMSLEGYRPIVCFERTNFLWAAADAIRHHLCMLPLLSGGQFDFPVVLRAISGDHKPLDPGKQHYAGQAITFALACNLEYRECYTLFDIVQAYKQASTTKTPLLIIEYKKMYNDPIG